MRSDTRGLSGISGYKGGSLAKTLADACPPCEASGHSALALRAEPGALRKPRASPGRGAALDRIFVALSGRGS